MKIKDVFYLNQGHQITDKELYYDIGKIPVITGNNEIKGYWNNFIITKEDLPCITYPTKGNSGVCYVQHSIFDANNTAILIPKPEWRSKIVLEWITFKLSKIFPNITTSKKGVSYLNKEIVDETEIEIPSRETQIKELVAFSKLIQLKNNITSTLQQIKSIKSSSLKIDYKQYQGKTISVKKIFECMSGNSGLTEEFLYSQILYDSEQKYLLLTGSINYSSERFIHQCINPQNSEKLISVLENESIIHVIRKGIFAGTVNYFEIGNYTINDDAYLLYLKKDSGYEINLQWIMYQLQETFFDYISSSDNKTWNMTGFFDNVYVDIPMIEEQNRVVEQYSKITIIQKNIICVINEIDSILQRELVQN